MNKKIVLVTGASSGMGKELARLLADQGHRVYAGARRLEKMKELESAGVMPIAMDVSKDKDNKHAIEQIIHNESRIDTLVNNAGFGLYGPVEEITLEDARYQFEVNIFGVASLTKYVLPHMRNQRSGRIINVSSMGGKMYTPLGAWYHATKHALEGWSDCLRLETKQFGIDVVLVEPGAIRTDFGEVVSQSLSKYMDGSAYRNMIEPYIKLMNSPRFATMGTDATVLAKVMAEAVNATKPKTRYVKGMMAKPLMFIRKYFGDRFFDFVISRAFG